jgi:hypothetical protein
VEAMDLLGRRLAHKGPARILTNGSHNVSHNS